jgi:hypothetical protein
MHLLMSTSGPPLWSSAWRDETPRGDATAAETQALRDCMLSLKRQAVAHVEAGATDKARPVLRRALALAYELGDQTAFASVAQQLAQTGRPAAPRAAI